MGVLNVNDTRLVRVTVTVERADGKVIDWTIAERDPSDPIEGDVSYSREAVEDPFAEMPWVVRRPGKTELTVRAKGWLAD